MSVKTIAIVGQGLMGSAIAQHAAACGYGVLLYDLYPEMVEKSVDRIIAAYDKNVAKEKMSAEDAVAAKTRIKTATDIAELKGADMVIEAISENLELKQKTFASLEDICAPETVFATNTSSISITKIASVLKYPARLIGMHFFAPVPVMKLVEIIMGGETSEDTYGVIKELCDGLEKIAVKVCKDAPGFIVNRVLFAYFLECIHIYEEGIASKEDIDNAIKFGLNHPVPPFQMMDMGGLDTFPNVCASLQTIGTAGTTERFECPESMRKLYESGKYGRKTGEGWYKYN